jgi:hypothetical protein
MRRRPYAERTAYPKRFEAAGDVQHAGDVVTGYDPSAWLKPAAYE